jgi:hypothetical protein
VTCTQLVRRSGPWELWRRGGVLYVVPAVIDEMPGELREALDRRRRTLVEGRCPCGAVPDRARGEAAHEVDCPASDDAVAAIVDRTGWTW